MLTNHERRRRHMTDDLAYPFCAAEDESLLHLFRDCNRASRLWFSFQNLTDPEFWSERNWSKWLIRMLKDRRQDIEVGNRKLVFGVTLEWWLWRARNELIFSRRTLNTHDLYSKIKQSVNVKSISIALQLSSSISIQNRDLQ